MLAREQIIAHLDMDSFYASVEVRDDPSLSGKPVVIGSDPMDGKGRGVVSTCSYEARRYGIHSGMPISHAWRLCPHAVYIRPSGKYAAVSENIMDIIHEYTEEIEQVSIDEAYIDLTSLGSWKAAEYMAMTLKNVIKGRENLTCSIGLGPSRTYAKIASDLRKPDGLVILFPGEIEQSLSPLPVSVIPGVGKKSVTALEARGISVIRDLAALEIQQLQDLFGSKAVRIVEIITGRDREGLKKQAPRQSIGRETTFSEDTVDHTQISETFISLARSLQHHLLSRNIRFRTVGIRIRYTGFITISRAVSLFHPEDDCDIMIHHSLALFDEIWDGRPVRLVGIRLSGLVHPDPVQRTLDQFITL